MRIKILWEQKFAGAKVCGSKYFRGQNGFRAKGNFSKRRREQKGAKANVCGSIRVRDLTKGIAKTEVLFEAQKQTLF